MKKFQMVVLFHLLIFLPNLKVFVENNSHAPSPLLRKLLYVFIVMNEHVL
jgi:hypothetical protein